MFIFNKTNQNFQLVLFFRQMIIIIPNDCYFKMDLVQFQVSAVCEDKEKHALRMRIVRKQLFKIVKIYKL